MITPSHDVAAARDCGLQAIHLDRSGNSGAPAISTLDELLDPFCEFGVVEARLAAFDAQTGFSSSLLKTIRIAGTSHLDRTSHSLFPCPAFNSPTAPSRRFPPARRPSTSPADRRTARARRPSPPRSNGAIVDAARPLEELSSRRPDSAQAAHRPRPEALGVLRHSCAHVMARAVMRLYPGVSLAFGPTTGNGFYYDFDLDAQDQRRGLPADRSRDGEDHQRGRAVRAVQPAARRGAEVLRRPEAGPEGRAHRHRAGRPSDAQLLPAGGVRRPLPRPAHSRRRTHQGVQAARVAGSYWKGDANNKQLQRLYGTAFFGKKDLEAYLDQIEEAKRRDHRVLGKQHRPVHHHERRRPGAVPVAAQGGDRPRRCWKTSSSRSCCGAATSRSTRRTSAASSCTRPAATSRTTATSQFPPMFGHRPASSSITGSRRLQDGQAAPRRSKPTSSRPPRLLGCRLRRLYAQRLTPRRSSPCLRQVGATAGAVPAQADELPAPRADLQGRSRAATATCRCGWRSSAPSIATSSRAS